MRNDGVNSERRRFLTTTASVVGGAGAVAATVPFVSTLTPSAKAKAIGAPVEVDIGDLAVGERKIVKWRGKPVWILRRDDAAVDDLVSLDEVVKDPASDSEQQPSYARNEYRSQRPEYLIVLGICTHLGCSPVYARKGEGEAHNLGADWQGGFFCPCHGSRFDLAGRVYKGMPAPSNLVVPPHQYLSDSRVLIGDDSGLAQS
ncbi:MAG: ubiquinol-cytochrome c reductase iron-sulfur subunit [Gammaproteobacteria bacterium]|nr:ubiquinol-cytochrome c reductase iron-sulfur subunit [Gammaproteobacteria bacterium]MCY4209903.1 ubiquinol-cytochrome c reductase iron-sulfur subunit [Gammaproteobacteria bacterium]MCY4281636.1 ubiquinol-cytochrome c reductase iron-sulfur subunit [Gammaproteobacteria bacterium]